MIFADHIERLARAKGWLACQWAHCVPDVWTFRRSPQDSNGYVGMWEVCPPNSTEAITMPGESAALVLLLAVANFPTLEVGPCRRCDGTASEVVFRCPCDACDGSGRDRRTPAALVACIGSPWLADLLPGSSDRIVIAALRRFIAQHRDEALVLADRWMADGVGLSTIGISPLQGKRCRKCTSPAVWAGDKDGPYQAYHGYCHEHRPRDGYGDLLASAIQADYYYEPPGDVCPGRDHGDGYSPMLWRMLDGWLDGEPREGSTTMALTAAWERTTAQCPRCEGDGTVNRVQCSWCSGHGRVAKPRDAVVP